jgi:hypothetical protein
MCPIHAKSVVMCCGLFLLASCALHRQEHKASSGAAVSDAKEASTRALTSESGAKRLFQKLRSGTQGDRAAEVQKELQEWAFKLMDTRHQEDTQVIDEVPDLVLQIDPDNNDRAHAYPSVVLFGPSTPFGPSVWVLWKRGDVMWGLFISKRTLTLNLPPKVYSHREVSPGLEVVWYQ